MIFIFRRIRPRVPPRWLGDWCHTSASAGHMHGSSGERADCDRSLLWCCASRFSVLATMCRRCGSLDCRSPLNLLLMCVIHHHSGLIENARSSEVSRLSLFSRITVRASPLRLCGWSYRSPSVGSVHSSQQSEHIKNGRCTGVAGGHVFQFSANKAAWSRCGSASGLMHRNELD